MDQILHLPLDTLIPDPNQPRKDFYDIPLSELADSIRAVGVIQPIMIRRAEGMADDKYMIIAGERRWRASKIAGKETIPCLVRENANSLSVDEIYAQQLTENLFRQDLNPVEKAEFINGRIEYLKGKGVTNAIEQAAAELGVSNSWISKNTAILKYAPEIRALARNGRLRDYSLLKKLSDLKPDKREKAIELIEKGEFNSKEFFARKRYDKKPEEAKQEEFQKTEGDKAGKAKTSERIKLKLSRDDCVRLIDLTDYGFMLDRHSAEWRTSSAEEMTKYMELFLEWVRGAE